MTIAAILKATLIIYSSRFSPENMVKYTRNLANGTNSPYTYLILQISEEQIKQKQEWGTASDHIQL